MAMATGMVSKYLSRISVTWAGTEEAGQQLSAAPPTLTHHLFIRLQRDLEDVSLLRLGQEEEHGLGLVGGGADEDHPSLGVVQVILRVRGRRVKTPALV